MSSTVSRDESVLLALQRATHVTLDAVARAMDDLNISAAELNVLAALTGHDQPCTVSRLAADVGSRISTVSGVLDRLEARGYIARRAHQGDRRAVRVELTAKGSKIAARVREAFADLEHRALDGLSDRVRAGLRRALSALTEVSKRA